MSEKLKLALVGCGAISAWHRNAIAEVPEIEITAGGTTRAYTARVLDADEKRAAWPTLCGVYPAFDEYQARTDRDIPVFRCTPLA